MSIMNSVYLKFIQVIFMVYLVSAKEVSRCIPRERQALLDFKSGLFDHCGVLSSWGNATDCCQWKRIGCSNLTGHVLMLDLHSDDRYGSCLSGKINMSLMELQQLQHLNLSWNNFQKSHIPDFFGSLTNLRYLDLFASKFNGKIPSKFGSLSHLKYLNLGGNHLEGSIPYELGNLSNLQFLDLEGNYLIGNIAYQLGMLSNLQELYLGGYASDLKIDDANGGKWLSNLTSLTNLHLSWMSDLSNSHGWLQIISELPKLRELSLSECGLSDHFILSLRTTKLNFSTSLSVLDFSYNTFTSSLIFQWVSNISSNLVELHLSDNSLVLASSSNHFLTEMISKLPKLRTLRLSNCLLSDESLSSQTQTNFNSSFSTSLSILDLSYNTFKSSLIFQWVSNTSSNLVELDLSHNSLVLALSSNHFLTEMISKLPKLRTLRLSNCLLSDESLSSQTQTTFNSSFSTSLSILDLSYNTFRSSSMVFQWVSNISSNIWEDSASNDSSIVNVGGCVRNSLEELDLSSNKIIGTLPDLSIFSSLKKLYLSYNQLSGRIPEGSRLPSKLESLYLDSNSFEGGIPKSFGNICTLLVLDMSYNSLSGDIPMILNNLSGCVSDSLTTLSLSSNRISGRIPEDIKLLTQLKDFSIGSNPLEGGIPKSFGNACALRSLDMSNNSLNEELPVIIHHLSGCARYTLQELSLSSNKINGTLPDLSIFTLLKELDLSNNRLNDVISDSHFANLFKLKFLSLSDNSLALTFTKNWIPPFQLRFIGLSSCKLGPTFPKWLKTQDFESLEISDSGISDIVPKWFWAKLASGSVSNINISNNNLKGVIPNYPPPREPPLSISLASNQFEGPIPPFLRGAVALDLSKNKFTDSRSFLCTIGGVETIYQLDLSNNQLYGQIPNCWIHLKTLAYLDMSHNNFSGRMPTSIGTLGGLQALLLRNNSLTEEIPVSIMNCTKLVMLDVSENRLSGLIPSWIGSKLQDLQVLALKSNQLFGSLPLELCFLKNIQLLDVSLNNLSGQIPKCFQNFTSMAQKTSLRYSTSHLYYVNTSRMFGNQSYDLNVIMMWKGVEHQFVNNILMLLKSIDLSSNHFSKEIPAELGNLFELVSLNLSRNNLTGKIPSNIGNLTSLDSLDLSRNHLVGSIPTSLTQIDRLEMLDLSHNYLSGKIPTGTQLQTFEPSSYEDNVNLCGAPLEKCIERAPMPDDRLDKIQEDEDLFVTSGFYISMAFGFVVGFWGSFGSILFKRSWRHAYFRFLNSVVLCHGSSEICKVLELSTQRKTDR